MTTPSTGRGRVHPLPLHAQLAGLKQKVPGSDGFVRNNRLVWTGCITPTVRSVTYTVRIDVLLGKRPDISVLDPALEHWKGEPLPHTYPGEKLCVYMGDQWDASKSLVTFVLPWIVDWLLYYELWVGTGKWFGGGHEVSAKRERAATPTTELAGPLQRRSARR